MAENNAPKSEADVQLAQTPPPAVDAATEAPKAVETKAEPKEETSLTTEEFLERLRTAGLNPLRDAFNEYVSRVRQIGASFLGALESPPKKKG